MESFSSLFESLSQQIGSLLPGVLGVLLVIVIGFIVAGIVKRLFVALMKRTNLDERISSSISSDFRLDEFVGKLVYYLLILYTLIIALSMLGVTGVLEPLQDMLNQFTGFIPKLIGAGIIAFAGYIIGTLASEATGAISNSVESLSSRIGWNSEVSLTKILKQVVFFILFIPMLIAAIDFLGMQSISEPLTNVLSSMLEAIPNIIAAVVIIGAFYFIGKYVIQILVELMRSLGMDNIAGKLGLDKVIGSGSLSSMIGNVIFFFLMFGAVVTAMDKLELGQVSEVLNNLMAISGRIFFGLVILVAGNFIANMAADAMSANPENAGLAKIVRFAVLGIFLAIGLHAMGIAESIVNLAFGLTLGAIAVAFALSFGLGGREAAGKQMENFFNKWNNK